MTTLHIVKQGEFLSSIVKKYGYTDFTPVWNHPDNAQLKQLRGSPNVLFPGDRLHVPDAETDKVESGATETKHRFRIHISQLMLRLVLKDVNDEAIANKACSLKVDADQFELTSDGNGLIQQTISVTARHAKLKYDTIEQSLLIGEMDPVNQTSGQRARLNNLGYLAGTMDCENEKRLLSAIEEFQCDHGLSVDGVCGPNTQNKLVAVHGC